MSGCVSSSVLNTIPECAHFRGQGQCDGALSGQSGFAVGSIGFDRKPRSNRAHYGRSFAGMVRSQFVNAHTLR